MKSYTQYSNDFGTITGNTSTANITYGMTLVNDSLRYLTSKFYLNERSYTTTTISQQQFYNLPPQVKELINLTVTIGTVKWIPKVAPNRDYWDSLNVIQFYQDYPSFFFVYNNQVGIFPSPASDGNTITMNYKVRIKDLSQADYTTGTVSATQNSDVITGSGTTFIKNMEDRWIRISEPSGDGNWYQIKTFTDATHVTLYNNYTGPTISGASYTIGEMPIMPEDYQDLALYRALQIYYNSRVPNPQQSELYKGLYDSGYEMLNAEFGQKTTNVALTDTDAPVYNPNLFVRSQIQTNP